ncbi:MAG: hypothetical protein GC159_11980 [Phycisphaera sp.]|nr:hypothetical protein [Phycisphaera sp.]
MGTHRTNPTHALPLVAALTLCVSLTAAVTRADEPVDGAHIAPAGTGFYIELNDLESLRSTIKNDPLWKYLRANLPVPAKQAGAWAQVQQKMQMDGGEIFDRYFGRSVVLIAEHAGDNPPGVLMSRVDKADAKLAVDRLEFQPSADGPIGPFAIYQTTDTRTGVAFSERWMAMGDRKHGQYIKPIFESFGRGAKLADDPYYKAWTGLLPADRMGTIFARTPDHSEFHAIGAVRHGLNLSLHYAGQTRDATALFAKLGDAQAREFGPLPMSTVAAVTLNLYDSEPNPDVARAADAILAPKTLAGDVVPKLAAPLVLFAARVPGDAVSPAPGFDVPAAGLAIKLRDPAVADDLSRVLEHVRVMANFALMQQQKPTMEVRLGEHGDTKYMIVDLGAALAAQTGRPELRGVASFAYGRVGDWFVVTTHDHLFQECLDTLGSEGARLTDSEAFKALPLVDADRPVGAAFVRVEPLTEMLDTWVAHLRKMQPEAFAEAEQRTPSSPGARWAKGVLLIDGVLHHFKSFTLQTHRGDGDQMLGVAHFERN